MNNTNSNPSSAGLAIATLVLGLLSLLLSLFIIGALFGFVGAVLGAIHINRSKISRTMAVWGFALSLLGILASGCFTFGYIKFYKWARNKTQQEQTTSLDAWKGVAAPDLTLNTLDGQTIQLSTLKGKRVILDFWATWCPPCRMEIPHFIQLTGEISSNELTIIGISDEETGTLQHFIQQEGINYPIASTAQAPEPFNQVTSIPTTFFIDRNGIIRNILVGYHDYDTLKKTALTEE